MQTPKARGGTSEVPQRVSPRPARQLRPSPLDTPDSASSSSATQSTRTPKERSPKVTERKSPRSPVPEKRRPSRLSELESQIDRLQEDLKRAREQLSRSESGKKQAQDEAEESKSQVEKLSAKLEELQELSSSEEGRLAELQKISEERDLARRCELEGVEKQRSVDSAALASALDEVRWLKVQLEMVTSSEAEQAQRAESASTELRGLRGELAKTLSLVEEVKTRLKDCEESEARARGLVGETLMQLKAAEATVESLRLDGAKAALELDESRGRARELDARTGNGRSESGAPMRLEEEWIKSTVEVQAARELAERVKGELGAEIEELRANLMDKETELQCVAEENRELKASVRREGEEREAARAGEREAEARLGAAAEKLEAARAEIAAAEAEMRRVRVQSEQWRKAAEAAASMLGGDGKYMERAGSLDSTCYSSPVPGRFGSIFGDGDDDLLKKKNGNVLKKIGVLWKKPQK